MGTRGRRAIAIRWWFFTDLCLPWNQLVLLHVQLGCNSNSRWNTSPFVSTVQTTKRNDFQRMTHGQIASPCFRKHILRFECRQEWFRIQLEEGLWNCLPSACIASLLFCKGSVLNLEGGKNKNAEAFFFCVAEIKWPFYMWPMRCDLKHETCSLGDWLTCQIMAFYQLLHQLQVDWNLI